MALTLLAANNAQTVLAAGINSTATSLTVNTGTGDLFPSPVAGASFFKLTLVDAATGTLTEIVHVTARSGDIMTIDRGQEGTTARIWSANDIAANMMTAGTISYILSNFQPLDATLTALAALATGANKLPYFTGTDTASQTDLTQVGRDIIGKAAIADVLSYLGLGAAAKKDVGTGTGQLPSMASFTTNYDGGSAYQINWPSTVTGKTGSSLQLQSALVNLSPGYQVVTLPFAVPTQAVFCDVSLDAGSANPAGVIGAGLSDFNKIRLVNFGSTGATVRYYCWCV